MRNIDFDKWLNGTGSSGLGWYRPGEGQPYTPPPKPALPVATKPHPIGSMSDLQTPWNTSAQQLYMQPGQTFTPKSGTNPWIHNPDYPSAMNVQIPYLTWQQQQIMDNWERLNQSSAAQAAQAGYTKPGNLPQIGQPAQGPSAAQSWWAANNPQQVKSLLPSQTVQPGISGTQGGTNQPNASTLADNLRLIRERFATLGRSGSQEEYLALQEAMNQYGQMTQAPSQSSGVNPYKIFY